MSFSALHDQFSEISAVNPASTSALVQFLFCTLLGCNFARRRLSWEGQVVVLDHHLFRQGLHLGGIRPEIMPDRFGLTGASLTDGLGHVTLRDDVIPVKNFAG